MKYKAVQMSDFDLIRYKFKNIIIYSFIHGHSKILSYLLIRLNTNKC